MDNPQATNLTRAVKEIRDELHALNKTQSEQSKVLSRLLHPAFKPPVYDDPPPNPDNVVKTDIPVRIDWDSDPIEAVATVFQFRDGDISIQIQIAPGFAANQVINLVHVQPVEALLLSSIVLEKDE